MPKKWILGRTKDEAAAYLIGRIAAWIWGLPFVTAAIYAIWAAVRGPWGPEVFLGTLAAFAIPAMGIAAYRASRAMARLEAAASGALESSSVKDEPPLRPTAEMLEADRIQRQSKRERLIASWREMVFAAHRELQEAARTDQDITTASVLESQKEFLSLRQHLSDESRAAIWGRTFIVPPDQSSMSGALHSILRDIDRLEKQWGLM